MVAVWVAAAFCSLGLLQSMVGAIVVRRFSRRPRAEPAFCGPVTVLKPLHGDEPMLEEALASVCQQDYPVWQVVFGVADAADTALPVVGQLQARFPSCDIAVVVDPTQHGVNRKVGNLINMLPAAKHDVLVISDADMHVASDWLRRLAAALEQPGVGLVTTVYTGLEAWPLPPTPFRKGKGRFAGKLGAMQINQYFLPGALLARAMGRQDCLGATMMLRRETLERIGGFRALVDHLADDNVLGHLVQRLRLRVALADTVPATSVPERSLGELWRHELRWARTIRTLVPAQFAASVMQYPLAWAMLTVLFAGGAAWSLAWFAIAWGVRVLAARTAGEALGLANRASFWLLPLRELMSVAVLIASYASRRVVWRGQTMQAEGFKPR